MRAALGFFVFFYALIAALHFLVLFFLEIALEEALYVEVYSCIFLITFLLLWGLLRAFIKLSDYVAWLYLLGSGLKFGLFMLLLWPVFKADGTVSILEKTSFLIPYCSSLILETWLLISKLNKI